MNIYLGNYWGKKYDYLVNYQAYIKFVLKENIKFSNFSKHLEILYDTNMYIRNLFIPDKNQIIFDIGSQYGDYSLLWEKRYNAKIYAFELLKNNYDEMLKDLKLNNSKIKAFNIPIGDGSNISFITKGDMAINENSGNFVKSVKLDELIFNKFNVKPDIIKIDVEGFEYEVLKGSDNFLKLCLPKIIIETHNIELRKKCHSFLSDKGYLLIEEGRTVIDKYGNEITNLFYIKSN